MLQRVKGTETREKKSLVIKLGLRRTLFSFASRLPKALFSSASCFQKTQFSFASCFQETLFAFY